MLLLGASTERGARQSHISEEQEAELLNSPLEESPSPLIEKARIPSPEKKLDAVLATSLTHATVATPTLIYIVSAGSEVLEDPVFVADKVQEPLQVQWKSERALKVSTKRAQVFVQKENVRVADPTGLTFDVRVSFEIKDLIKPLGGK